MKFEKINISVNAKRVLVAPLDWGLGHATRCIPIIYALREQGLNIVIAAEGPIKNLLKNEFPDVVFTELKGYKMRYSRHKWALPFKLLLQFPKLLSITFWEHKWLKRAVRENNIDLIISDNRLGLFHKTIPCIYITHQLQIKTGTLLGDKLAQRLHYFFINKYTSCWVPDNEKENDLAGELSHPEKLPTVPLKYIGPVSRFEKAAAEKKYDLLILLSGPEPQRTVLENIMLKELQSFTGKVLLVKGLPGNDNNDLAAKNENNVTIKDHLPAAELNQAILQSGLVISRAGYTTIMDLVKLQQKAILIPTPGQTEQEYLGNYLMKKRFFLSIPQEQFSLEQALQQANSFSFSIPGIDAESFKCAIADFRF